MSNVLSEFSDRLIDEWLPTFCHDPKRQLALEGFDARNLKKVTQEDAHDFLRALASGVVVDTGGGRFRAFRSNANETIFDHGKKSEIPRPVRLWLEPIITIAAVARLHLDYGWPKELLGMQSSKWEFDLIAFPSENASAEHIAGEVKKTEAELDVLLMNMKILTLKTLNTKETLTQVQTNAYNKCLGLMRCRAPVFWAIGPGGLNHVFKVTYLPDETMRLTAATEEMFEYSKISSL